MPEDITGFSLAARLRQASRIALFLDYDGTLVPFERDPQAVRTPEAVSRCLQVLAARPDVFLTVISGRTLPDLQQRIPGPGITRAALHGLVIQHASGQTFTWIVPEADQALLKSAVVGGTILAEHEPGMLLENKGPSVALHYRGVPESRQAHVVEEIVSLIDTIDPLHRLDRVNGSKVVELRPKGWNKGKAVEFILASVALPCPPLPVYIGDDTTDEDAFRTLRSLGMTVLVSDILQRPTEAQYRVHSQDEVVAFLSDLADRPVAEPSGGSPCQPLSPSLR